MSKYVKDEGSGSPGLWGKRGLGRGNSPAAEGCLVCEGSPEASVVEVESEGRAVEKEVRQVPGAMFIKSGQVKVEAAAEKQQGSQVTGDRTEGSGWGVPPRPPWRLRAWARLPGVLPFAGLG